MGFHIDSNNKAAAVRAGYSPRNRPDFFDRLAKKLESEIEQYGKELYSKAHIANGRLIQELMLLAFADMKDFVNTDGDLLVDNLEQLGDFSRCIQEITITETQDKKKRIKLKLYSKDAALEKLSKIGGLYDDGRGQLPPMMFQINIGGKKPETIEINPSP